MLRSTASATDKEGDCSSPYAQDSSLQALAAFPQASGAVRNWERIRARKGIKTRSAASAAAGEHAGGMTGGQRQCLDTEAQERGMEVSARLGATPEGLTHPTTVNRAC